MTPAFDAKESDPLQWLYGVQLFGVKMGLESVRRLLRELDLPMQGQRFIHVAGTNGKGSTCAMIHAILGSAGINAGLFTSPHLVRFNERIRDWQRTISDEELMAGITVLRDLVRTWDPHPTFFELAFALALDWYRRHGLEWVVLETGMGGRLDATNAITPEVSVITPVGMDHMQVLGGTLEAIAREKAGIIKPGVPVVTAPQEPEVMRVIQAAAAAAGAPLTGVSAPWSGEVGLRGAHQAWNAALAVAAARQACHGIAEESIAEGLRNVRWPGRFQVWGAGSRLILDGAHNAHAARALRAAWQREFPGERATLVLGVSSGKDTPALMRELEPLAARWVVADFRSPRAVPGATVQGWLEDAGASAPVFSAASAQEALKLAAEFPERCLMTGSLFFVGEVLAHLQGTPGALEPAWQ